MTEKFKGISRTGRVAGIVVGSVISALFVLLSIWSFVEMVQMRSFEYEGKPFWIGALIITFVALSASFITWKLFYQSNAVHGTVNLPLWFIRLFGVFSLALLSAAAYWQDSIYLMAGAALVSLPMILFGKGISKRPR